MTACRVGCSEQMIEERREEKSYEDMDLTRVK